MLFQMPNLFNDKHMTTQTLLIELLTEELPLKP